MLGMWAVPENPQSGAIAITWEGGRARQSGTAAREAWPPTVPRMADGTWFSLPPQGVRDTTAFGDLM